MRVAITTDLVTTIFHKRDQEILKLFENIDLGEHDLSNGYKVQDFLVSFKVANGNEHDYDMEVGLDDQKFLGVDAKGLKFTGSGNIVQGEGDSAVKEAFTIEGPISAFRVELEIKTNETNGSKYTGLKKTVFTIDTAATTVTTSS